MLEKLLAEIQNGNTTSPSVLAEHMKVSVGMVQAMLATLEEQGYLKSMSAPCNDEKPCGSCPVSNLCSSKSAANPRILVRTEK